MMAGWRTLRISPVRRCGRRRRIPGLGFEILEDRRLLAALSTEYGFALSAYNLEVAEGAGVPQAFEVVLTAQPTSDVMLDVSNGDPAEVDVWPVRLIFTPENWELPQAVWMDAVDDILIDGTQRTEILISVDPSASDANFASLPYQSTYAVTLDNDIPGFTLSETALTVSESGTAATFTVALTGQPQTYVTLVAIGENEAEATLSPTVLTFSPADWNQPQTITVTGQDDPRVDGDQTSLVTVEVAIGISDGFFAALAAQTVVVTTTDDDVAGFTLNKTIAVVSEAGTTDRFSAVLTAQPVSNVRLTVSASDAGEATIDPTELVFTPADWDLPQTVTIRGVDDFDRDGVQESLVTVAVDAPSTDSSFAELAAQTVFVTTADNDYGWHNPDNSFDTDGDGMVTANDALILINYINGNSGNSALPSSVVSPPPYYDVNDDSFCTALDILLVINFINAQAAAAASSSGEGESMGARESLGTVQETSSTSSFVPLEGQLIAARQPASQPEESPSTVLAAPRSISAAVPFPAQPTADLRHATQPVRIAPRVADDWAAIVDAAWELWEPQWGELGIPTP
jgi:hypothetical protein